MSSISTNGSDVILFSETEYIVIDALYLNDIRIGLPTIDVEIDEDSVKRQLFPYSDSAFTSFFIPQTNTLLYDFKISSIKTFQEETQNISHAFSVDSGLIVIIDRTLFFDFAQAFNYDSLIHSITIPIDLDYWHQLETKFGEHKCALIETPGIGRGFDFEGGGIFVININDEL